jgi:hypothetical protein
MTYPIALLIGVVAGVATGYVAARVPVPPILQSVGAAVVGMLLASLAAAVVWLLRPPPDATVLAVNFGMRRAGVVGACLAVGAAALHATLDRAGGATLPALAGRRAILFGLIGAMYGAVSAVSGLGVVAPLR